VSQRRGGNRHIGDYTFMHRGEVWYGHVEGDYWIVCKGKATVADWQSIANRFFWGDSGKFDLEDQVIHSPLVIQSQCVAETVGVMELASWAGALSIDKRSHGAFVLGSRGARDGLSASEETNALNYFSRMAGRRIFGRNIRLPFRVFGSNSPYTIAGRVNAVFAKGLYAYDAVMVANL